MTSHRPTAALAFALAGLASLLASCGGGSDGESAPPPDPLQIARPAPGVNGPAWRGFGNDAQHSALAALATQDLNRIAWQVAIDLAPQYRPSGALPTHYGSPVVTARNTVIVPVKTGATGGFRFEARSGTNGGLIWWATSDYVLPAHNWIPSYNIALTPDNRLFAPGAGGKLFVRENADAASGRLSTAVFYGAAAYAAAPARFDATVFINTPVTVDGQGNAFFGFVVTGTNPAGLSSGIARLGADGRGSWVSAAAAAGDARIAKVAMNSAPALSPDGATLYVAVNTSGAGDAFPTGHLLALDSRTLARRHRVALRDPDTGSLARISDDSTASPTIGPDGAVYFGVLESVFGAHNSRGWLLQFDAALAPRGAPGGFGWDDTASIVPAAMLPQYTGPSSYLLMVKYNNYLGRGWGDGLNRLAIIDPNQDQVEAISGVTIMRELLTILGPTFEDGNAGPVKEWCINTVAVDPLTGSVLANSEDGHLYRWHLASNRFTQRIRLTSGIAESYTPTAVGADGAVYAVNNAVLFSIAR